MLRFAKTSLPSVAHAVPRERLFARLDGALARSGTWVSGPPGAGKTTLVASYVAARKLDCLWYHVDAGDVDLASFFHYLALAVQREGATRDALPRFTPEYLGGEAAFARRFFRELASRDDRPSLLVFDDLGAVPHEAPLHAVLREGLEELSNGTRAVLISRQDPGAPFARLLANGVLERIGGEELLLSPPEAFAVARAHAPPGAPGDDLARACERAAGWTAGVVLLASAPGVSNERVAPSPILFDYLAGEIFDRADPHEQRVLLCAALLPVVPADLANRLCGSPRADAILGALAGRAYFTLRRGDAQPAFELHPLLREFLVARARSQLAPDELRRFRERAASVLAEAGHSEPAVELFLEAEAWSAAARIVLATAPTLQATGRTRTLERWLSMLPPALRERDPWLSYWLGLCRVPFDPAAARADLARAFDAFAGAGEVEGAYLAWAAIMESLVRRWTDFHEMDAWIDRLGALRRRHPAAVAPPVEQRTMVALFAALVFHRPESRAIEELEERAFDLAMDRAAPLPVRVTVAHWLVVWFAMRGENARAASVVDTIAPLSRAEGVDPLTRISWLASEAVHCWHVGAAPRAAQAVDEGLALARASGIHVWDVVLHFQRVNAALAQDDLDGARSTLAALERTVGRDDLLALPTFEHERANVFVRAGERDRALESARAVLALGRGLGMPFCDLLANLTLALVPTADGDAAAAAPHLEVLRRLGDAMRSEFAACLRRHCEAELSRRAGDLRAAAEHLTHAFRLSREKRIAPDVWFSRPQLAALCALAFEAGVETGHARGLVTRLRLEPEGLAQTLEEWPWPAQVRVLGRLEASVGGEPLQTASSARRPLDVVAALVASAREEAGEQLVAGLLWPDSEGDLAHHALETALYRLRKLIGPGAVVHRNRVLRLDPRRCWVDAVALDALLRHASACLARRDLPAALAATARAVRLYRGPFLAGRGEPWVLGARRRLRDEVRRAIAELARHDAAWDRVHELKARISAADPEADLERPAPEP